MKLLVTTPVSRTQGKRKSVALTKDREVGRNSGSPSSNDIREEKRATDQARRDPVAPDLFPEPASHRRRRVHVFQTGARVLSIIRVVVDPRVARSRPTERQGRTVPSLLRSPSPRPSSPPATVCFPAKTRDHLRPSPSTHQRSLVA